MSSTPQHYLTHVCALLAPSCADSDCSRLSFANSSTQHYEDATYCNSNGTLPKIAGASVIRHGNDGCFSGSNSAMVHGSSSLPRISCNGGHDSLRSSLDDSQASIGSSQAVDATICLIHHMPASSCPSPEKASVLAMHDARSEHSQSHLPLALPEVLLVCSAAVPAAAADVDYAGVHTRQQTQQLLEVRRPHRLASQGSNPDILNTDADCSKLQLSTMAADHDRKVECGHSLYSSTSVNSVLEAGGGKEQLSFFAGDAVEVVEEAVEADAQRRASGAQVHILSASEEAEVTAPWLSLAPCETSTAAAITSPSTAASASCETPVVFSPATPTGLGSGLDADDEADDTGGDSSKDGYACGSDPSCTVFDAGSSGFYGDASTLSSSMQGLALLLAQLPHGSRHASSRQGSRHTSRHPSYHGSSQHRTLSRRHGKQARTRSGSLAQPDVDSQGLSSTRSQMLCSSNGQQPVVLSSGSNVAVTSPDSNPQMMMMSSTRHMRALRKTGSGRHHSALEELSGAHDGNDSSGDESPLAAAGAAAAAAAAATAAAAAAVADTSKDGWRQLRRSLTMPLEMRPATAPRPHATYGGYTPISEVLDTMSALLEPEFRRWKAQQAYEQVFAQDAQAGLPLEHVLRQSQQQPSEQQQPEFDFQEALDPQGNSCRHSIPSAAAAILVMRNQHLQLSHHHSHNHPHHLHLDQHLLNQRQQVAQHRQQPLPSVTSAQEQRRVDRYYGAHSGIHIAGRLSSSFHNHSPSEGTTSFEGPHSFYLCPPPALHPSKPQAASSVSAETGSLHLTPPVPYGDEEYDAGGTSMYQTPSSCGLPRYGRHPVANLTGGSKPRSGLWSSLFSAFSGLTTCFGGGGDGACTSGRNDLSRYSSSECSGYDHPAPGCPSGAFAYATAGTSADTTPTSTVGEPSLHSRYVHQPPSPPRAVQRHTQTRGTSRLSGTFVAAPMAASAGDAVTERVSRGSAAAASAADRNSGSARSSLASIIKPAAAPISSGMPWLDESYLSTRGSSTSINSGGGSGFMRSHTVPMLDLSVCPTDFSITTNPIEGGSAGGGTYMYSNHAQQRSSNPKAVGGEDKDMRVSTYNVLARSRNSQQPTRPPLARLATSASGYLSGGNGYTSGCPVAPGASPHSPRLQPLLESAEVFPHMQAPPPREVDPADALAMFMQAAEDGPDAFAAANADVLQVQLLRLQLATEWHRQQQQRASEDSRCAKDSRNQQQTGYLAHTMSAEEHLQQHVFLQQQMQQQQALQQQALQQRLHVAAACNDHRQLMLSTRSSLTQFGAQLASPRVSVGHQRLYMAGGEEERRQNGNNDTAAVEVDAGSYGAGNGGVDSQRGSGHQASTSELPSHLQLPAGIPSGLWEQQLRAHELYGEGGAAHLTTESDLQRLLMWQAKVQGGSMNGSLDSLTEPRSLRLRSQLLSMS